MRLLYAVTLKMLKSVYDSTNFPALCLTSDDDFILFVSLLLQKENLIPNLTQRYKSQIHCNMLVLVFSELILHRGFFLVE